jgi:hypothetical protein
MTREEALEFLRSHQPMPPESEISDELVSRYNEVRQHFVDNPDPLCIPLFLGSFGEGSGLGVYQLCDEVFAQYSRVDVVPHILSALQSPHRSVRAWSAEWAVGFPARELIAPLEAMLNSEEDHLARLAVISALESIWRGTGSASALGAIGRWRPAVNDPDLRDAIDELFSGRN